MEILKAINAVQAELSKEGISKARKNQAQGYSFRGIDDMYNVMSRLLASNSIVVLPSYSERQVVERESAKGGALFYVTLRGEFAFRSSKDESEVKVVTYGEAMDSGDKATNKAMSAALKYAFMQTFTIPTEGDNDSENTTHEVKADTRSPLPAMQEDAFNLLPKEEQEFLRKLAADVIALVEERRETEAYGMIEHNNLDNEEKLGLWWLLQPHSKVRSAIKAAGTQADLAARAEKRNASAGATTGQ